MNNSEGGIYLDFSCPKCQNEEVKITGKFEDGVQDFYCECQTCGAVYTITGDGVKKIKEEAIN